MTSKRELRQAPVELRQEDDGIAIEGYAATFNDTTDIGGMFDERITPGAFADSLGRDDVVLNVDHQGLPLARTSSGTLTLSEDKRGLKIATNLEASDPDVQRIVPKMQRGDLSKMSFAFTIDDQTIEEREGEVPLRTIDRATLYDVSIVTTPAYDTTEVGLRSIEAHRATKVPTVDRRRRFNMKIATE